MIKIAYLDFVVFRTRYSTLCLYVCARILVQHPNHHHVLLRRLHHHHLLLMHTAEVPAVPVVILAGTPCTLLTWLSQCNDSTPRCHLYLLFLLHNLVCIFTALHDDLANVCQLLSLQLVISDG